MKRLGFILVSAIIFNACDDGDIVLQSFNFSGQNIQACENKNFLFKTKKDELLLISIPENSLANEETPENTPREINIGTGVGAVYRKYNGNVTSQVICNALPPATPYVTKEWIASGGKILIQTKALHEDENDETKITGHTHNIRFENITFTGHSEEFSFNSYIFGDFVTR